MRDRITSTRTSTSRDAATSTVRPNRSSNCGRSSPSSGFMVPIRTNLASCECDMPSRSTCTRPIAAASSSTSTRWSCRRLTSSTYSTPPCARASRPGENACSPSRNTFCRSSEPTTRSSVAPMGSSTSRASSSTSRSTAARPRTAVDFAVPFSPRISTPPISGRTAHNTRASRSRSCPTSALNGYSTVTRDSPAAPSARAGCRRRETRHRRGRSRAGRTCPPDTSGN